LPVNNRRGVHLSGALGRGTRKVRSVEEEPGESLCVEQDKGATTLVDVLWDGACPALNSPMLVVDSSGRKSDYSKRKRVFVSGGGIGLMS